MLFSTVACSSPATINKDQTFEMPEDPIPIVFRILQMQPQRCSVKKAFLKNFAILTGKRVSETLFDKVAGLQAWNFIKKRLQHKVFCCEYCEIFKSTYFEKTSANGCFSPCLISMMELFAKINNSFQSLIIFAKKLLNRFLREF